MKKITSLLMMFMLFVGMGWAQESTPTPAPEGFPQTSSADSPKFYLIKNVRSGKYATFQSDNEQMQQTLGSRTGCLFWFEAGADGQAENDVLIHNAATKNTIYLESISKWSTTKTNWYVLTSPNKDYPGLAICNKNDVGAPNTGGPAWNNAGNRGQEIGTWSGNDPSSTWVFISVDDEVSAIIASMESKRMGSLVLDSSVKELGEKCLSSKSVKDYGEFLAAKAEHTAVMMPKEGKTYIVKSAYAAYMEKQHVEKALYDNGTKPMWGTVNTLQGNYYWKLTQKGDGYTFQNLATDKYVKALDATSSLEADAATIKMESLGQCKWKLTLGGKTFHTNNHEKGSGQGSNIVSWWGDPLGSSDWYVEEIDANEAAAPFFEVTTDPQHPVLYYMVANTTRDAGGFKNPRRLSNNNGTLDYPSHFASNTFDKATQAGNLNAVLNDLWYVTGSVKDGFVFHNADKVLSASLTNGQPLTGGEATLCAEGESDNVSNVKTWNLRLGQRSDGSWNDGTTGEFGITATVGGNSANLDGNQHKLLFGWGGFDKGSSLFMVEAVIDIPMNLVDENSFATLSLPYDFSVVENDANTKLYTATSVADHILNCTEVTAVTAGAGVVVKNTAAAEKVSVVIKPAVEEMGANLLKGNLQEIAFNDLSDKLVFGRSKTTGAVGFFSAGGTAPLGANKAYLPVSALPAGSNVMVLSFGEGDVTGIEGVEAEASVNASIYDLSGRRVLNTVKGGIYIQDGKKFIVR